MFIIITTTHFWPFSNSYLDESARKLKSCFSLLAFIFEIIIGPCHVSGIFLPLRVKSLPLATIYEVKIPLRKWKKSLLQRNPAQMTSAIDQLSLFALNTQFIFSNCDVTVIRDWT
jgi:hypothetical protein